jgi:WD40 repeat protein
MKSERPTDELSLQDLRSVLDEELGRLPEKYRAPVVLCYLEGQSYEHAARQLGCPKPSLASRLARAHELLRNRLERRGITLAAAALTTALAEMASAAPLPAMLTIKTIKAAALIAAGKSVAGCLSAGAVALAEEAVAGMLGIKAKLAFIVLALGLAVGGAGWAGGGLGQKAEPAAQAPVAKEVAGGAAKKEPAVDQYGDALPEGAVARLGTARLRHAGLISFLALTPDGAFIVSQGESGMRVWDAKTGKELRHAPELASGYSNNACDLSPDGRTLATLERKGNTVYSVALWDIATGRRLRELGKPAMLPSVVRFLPDGKHLVTDSGNSVNVLDLATGETIRSWQPHGKYGFCAALSHDGKTIVTALVTSGPGAIRFWDIATGKLTREINSESKPIDRIDLSPDGKLLASRGSMVSIGGGGGVSRPENLIRIWDVPAGKEVRQLLVPHYNVSGYDGSFADFLFAPDGKSLVTCGMDWALRIWDATTGKELRQVFLDSYLATHLAFSRDGKKLATTTTGLTIRLFDFESGQELVPPGEHQTAVGRLAFSGDGRSLVTSSATSIHLWDTPSSRLRFRLDVKDQFVNDICLASDGRTLFCATRIGISAWNFETRQKLGGFATGPVSGRINFAVAPDGKTVALVKGTSVELVEARTGKPVKQFDGPGPTTYDVVFLEGGTKLMALSTDKVHVWDLTGGRKHLQFSLPTDRGPLYKVAISGDGCRIALGSHEASQKNHLVIMESTTGRELGYAAVWEAQLCALSPDGQTLAFVRNWTDPAVRLLETASGRERRSLLGHKGRVTSLAFSSDGKTLASGGMDTTALVWDLGTLETRKTALSNQDMNACWEDLAGDDAARAFEAIRNLAADPTRAVPFLDKRLQPAPAVDEKELSQLIAELGNEAFAVRDKATRQLEKLGELADPACRKALQEPTTLELRRRLENLLEKFKQRARNPTPAFLRSVRALEALELAGIPKARDVLARMSQGASQARFTMDAKAALERLDRARLPSTTRD